jgi:hypothetical protein
MEKSTTAMKKAPRIPMSDDERKARILIEEAKKSPADTLTRMIRKATASTIRKYMKDGHGILLSVPQSATLAAEWLGPPVRRIRAE